ncbi:hypothetical protein PFISCL1PPCAC_12116, partial [Pristionchus fissidentatus]
CIIGGRKLHMFIYDHHVLDIDTYHWSIVRTPSVDAENIYLTFTVAEQLFFIDKSCNFTVYRFNSDINEFQKVNIRLPDECGVYESWDVAVSASRIFLLGGGNGYKLSGMLLKHICVIQTNPSLADWAASSLMKCKNGKK